MKTGISILLSFLLLNSLFYYGYFSVSVIHAKMEAHETISQIDNNKKNNLIKISVNKLDKDESDEVWYHGKLYDVVKRESVNDTVYAYLLQDKNEEQLLKDNYNYFKNDTGVFCASSIKIPHSRKIVSLPDGQYIVPSLQKSNYYYFISITPAVKNEYYFNRFNTEVPTPPPKLSVAIQEC